MVRNIVHIIVLWLSLSFAFQLRTLLSLGEPIAASQQPPVEVLVLILLVVPVVWMLGRRIRPLDAWLGDAHVFRQHVVYLAVTALLWALFYPQTDMLLLAYYVILGLLLGILIITVPTRIYVGQPGVSLKRDFRALWNARWLYVLWLRSNIETRYSQRLLGSLWIILIPFSSAVVLTIAFTQLMRIQLDVPFIAFYMAGLVAYNLFSNGIIAGSSAIRFHIFLITQVNFPREILVLLVLGELLIDFAVMLVSALVINVLYGLFPNIYFFYLPLLLIILVGITLGAMLLASSMAVLIRDVPQLLSVALQAFFFLTPVIYPVDMIPESFRLLFMFNPVAPIIQGFRDVLVYARPVDLNTLIFPVIVALVLLAVGYTTFKSVEAEMADLL